MFARLTNDGPGFDEYFGDSLVSIDNMVDRSPEGKLEVAGGVLRYLHDCNWKMFVENLNDTMHPMVAHESSAGTAVKMWRDKPTDEPKPMAIEQFVPFVATTSSSTTWACACSTTATVTRAPILDPFQVFGGPAYETRWSQAYGEERAQAILGETRHNTVYFPNLTIKGAIQAIRVATDRAGQDADRELDVPAGRRTARCCSAP